jgi:hypothetical protein
MTVKEYVAPLRSFVNNPVQWHAFVQFIDDEISNANRKLQQSDNVVDIHRAQGAVHQLQRILKLKEMFNEPR